jgi:pimeloyl-ACP methyl ester carboxylesterase
MPKTHSSSSFVRGTKNVNLHVKTWGDVKKTPIVFVHGYPDSHVIWLPIIDQLAAQFFVIAYDVRGAGQSDIPAKIADYRLDILSQDLAVVVNNIIPDRRFHLVAHDWGSIQSWESVTTDRLKGRIASYTTLSGPSLDHAGHWMQHRLRHPSVDPKHNAIKQLFSSWYIMMFQLPVLPEFIWKNGLGKKWSKYLEVREGVREPHPNPTQTRDGQYGVRLYRANFISKMTMPKERHAHCPVQLIVLKKDLYVNAFLFDDLTHWVKDLYRRELDAGHWSILIESKKIAEWISEWVTAQESGDLTKIASLKVSA